MSTSHTYLYNPLAVLDQVVVLDTVDQQTLTATSEVTDHPVEAPSEGDPDSISDHQINHPNKISISGFISNTPKDDLSYARKGDGVPINISARGSFQTTNIVVPSYDPVSEAVARRNPITGEVTLTNQSLRSGQQTIAVSGLTFPDEVNPVKDALVLLELWKQTKLPIVYVDPMFIWRRMAVESYSCTLEGKIAATGQPGGATFTIDLKQIAIVKSASAAAPVPKEPRGQHEKNKGKSTPVETEAFDYYETLDGSMSQTAPRGTPPENLRHPLTGEFDAGGGWVLIGGAP